MPEIQQLHAKHYGVYGRRKMHALLKREGWKIGRDQTERLMRLAGVRGVRKSKRVPTTRPDKAAVLPADLANRRFVADGPRKLRVCDVTYVSTWSGFAYVAVVTHVYSPRIEGWNVASTLRSEILPMQAVDMAAWQSVGRLELEQADDAGLLDDLPDPRIGRLQRIFEEHRPAGQTVLVEQVVTDIDKLVKDFDPFKGWETQEASQKELSRRLRKLFRNHKLPLNGEPFASAWEYIRKHY